MLTEYIAFPFAFAYILCPAGSKSDNRTSEVIRTNSILLSFIVVNPPLLIRLSIYGRNLLAMTYDEINLYHDMSWCNQKEGGRIFVTINGGALMRNMAKL